MELIEPGRYRKTIFIRDLQKVCDLEKPFCEEFFLERVTYSVNGNGNKWQKILLRDVTGKIEGKIWEEHINPEYEKYAGSVVLVRGKFTLHEGRPDFAIKSIEVAEQYNIADYIKVINADEKQKYIEYIKKIIGFISVPEYAAFVKEFINDSTLEKMAEMPFEADGPYSYIGGLLALTAQVAARTYYQLSVFCPVKSDLSLGLTAALVAHIGKLDSLIQKGIFFFERLENKMVAPYMDSITKILQSQGYARLSDREQAELLHIINVISGNVQAGIPEAKLVASAVETSLYIGMYSNDFDIYDQDYSRNNSECIDSRSLGNKIFRRKERVKSERTLDA